MNENKRPLTVASSSPGSWNPDATESSMPKGDFLEARNYRKPQTDLWEVRSGVKTKVLERGIACGAAEYRLDDQYVNVLFYDHFSELRVTVFDGDRSPELQYTFPIVPIDSRPPEGYQVQAVQFNTFLILTVYNVGVFAIFPTAADLTAWNYRELGKIESPAPNSLSYAAEVTGDLIVYQCLTSPSFVATGAFADGEKEPIKIRIAMGAQYSRVGDSGAHGVNLQATNLVKQFEPESESSGASDASPHLQSGTSQRALGTKWHLQKRGWFYKFLVKSQYTDIRGQKITYYHEPSVDIFVPDNDYAPPFVLRSGATPAVPPWGGAITHTVNLGSLPDEVEAWDNTLLPAGETGNVDLRTMPDIGATSPFDGAVYLKFIKAFKNYFHDNSANGKTSRGVHTQPPYLFTSIALGYQTSAFPTGSIAPTQVIWNTYPYKISVPVSELLGAPQTVFRWSDFSELPPDAIEIEIYRTAHTDSDQYAPNVYGLAGTLASPGSGSASSFTDATADWDLDFNGRVSSQVGYLQDEFSGKTIRVYSNNIRLGDTVTALTIRKPSKLVQAFAFDGGDLVVLLTKTSLTGAAFDGLPAVAFGYQYVDTNGYVSDIRTFPVDVTGAADATVGVAMTFPHGYNDTIKNIYVFEGHVVAGAREWRRCATVDPQDGHLIYPGNLIWTGLPLITAGDRVVSKDRGACIWTEESDMAFWPPENFELEHEFAPVTHIDNTVGPSLVLTDMSQVQTTFGEDNRWEEVHDKIGSIGRQCALKVGRPVFYLSSGGLMMTEGYGIRPFPGQTQEVIRKYLLEEIAGVPSLANARRASLGWLGRRNELWLHIPSSADLGGLLPAVTIVYQFFLDYGSYSPKDAQNYSFDIIPDGPGTPVFFISSARGRLFAYFDDPANTRTLFVDCDDSSPWNSDAYLTLPLSLQSPDLKKELLKVSMMHDRDCNMDFATGQRRTDGIDDDLVHGLLDPLCAINTIPQPAAKFLQPFSQPIDESDVRNIKDRLPLVRFHTWPNAAGAHICRIQSFAVELAVEGTTDAART